MKPRGEAGGGGGRPPIIKAQPSTSCKEEAKCNPPSSPHDWRESREKGRRSRLQREGERIRREYAASVQASWEKRRVAETRKALTPAAAIKERIRRAFTNITGKEMMGRE